jgi:hypothetical protein
MVLGVLIMPWYNHHDSGIIKHLFFVISGCDNVACTQMQKYTKTTVKVFHPSGGGGVDAIVNHCWFRKGGKVYFYYILFNT